MKLKSPLFDRVRVKPEEDRTLRDNAPACEWPGCERSGGYPAPKGRRHEGQYHSFCLEHVRQYNKTYNYFEGMGNSEVTDWQKQSATGHRPTWKLGENAWAGRRANGTRARGPRDGADFADPFGLFGKVGGQTANDSRPARSVRRQELKALQSLGLDETATPEQVKSTYKTLVKRLHPDANGGSRANEDRLREIIQAYDYLRTAGFC